MDTDVLVKEAQTLLASLDRTKVAPRAMVIVVSEETGNWRLWIVPGDDKINKQEFYRIVADSITGCGLSAIDVGTVELVVSNDIAIGGLSKMFRVTGSSSVSISNNTYNGVLLPDGVVIRMNI